MTFRNYALGSKSLGDVAKELHLTERALALRFEPFWRRVPVPARAPACAGLVLDATTVVRGEAVALVALDPSRGTVVSWAFAPRESYAAWAAFLGTVPPPTFVVSDAQKGLVKAVNEAFPGARHQRCLTHVVRRSNAWLTRSPQTEAARELRSLVGDLPAVGTTGQRDAWIASFRDWDARHRKFLGERTVSPTTGRMRYVHRRVRGIRSMVVNSLPSIFSFVDDPLIPKTSNGVEGGINSPLKDLFRKHRGLTGEKKIALTAYYLQKRQGENQH